MGSFELRCEITIDAMPEQVWDVLADFTGYPDWNPLVRSLAGGRTVGSKLRARFEPFPKRGLRTTLTLSDSSPPRRLAWRGGVKGLLAGEHYFELIPTDGGTRLLNVETFEGVASAIVGPVIRKSLPQYERLNTALKERVEARVRRG